MLSEIQSPLQVSLWSLSPLGCSEPQNLPQSQRGLDHHRLPTGRRGPAGRTQALSPTHTDHSAFSVSFPMGRGLSA